MGVAVRCSGGKNGGRRVIEVWSRSRNGAAFIISREDGKIEMAVGMKAVPETSQREVSSSIVDYSEDV